MEPLRCDIYDGDTRLCENVTVEIYREGWTLDRGTSVRIPGGATILIYPQQPNLVLSPDFPYEIRPVNADTRAIVFIPSRIGIPVEHEADHTRVKAG